jgi:hypothetical protein
VGGWAVSEIGEVPTVPGGEADDPAWHPLQHFFGLTTFGANLFVAVEGHETLVAAHDEETSGQQELYLVLDGEAEFELAGERIRATKGRAVAVTDPAVRRRAIALAPGTTLLAVGASEGPFSTTWRKSHFENVPRAGDR